MKNNDLLPCPFCGTPRPAIWKRDDGWVIKCVNGCSITIEHYNSRAGAKKAWNRRPEIIGPNIRPLPLPGNDY